MLRHTFIISLREHLKTLKWLQINALTYYFFYKYWSIMIVASVRAESFFTPQWPLSFFSPNDYIQLFRVALPNWKSTDFEKEQILVLAWQIFAQQNLLSFRVFREKPYRGPWHSLKKNKQWPTIWTKKIPTRSIKNVLEISNMFLKSPWFFFLFCTSILYK